MAMSIPKTIVHIGYAKAASSTLQAFFSACPSVHHVDRGVAFKLLTAPNAFDYDQTAAVDFFTQQAEQAASSGNTLVISHERLSGNPHSGHYDDTLIAQRIANVLPGAHVLISIREQLALISSIYKQYLRIGGTMTFRQYTMPMRDYRIPGFNHSKYEYHHLIKHYQDLLGNDHVHVSLVEDLALDPDSYFQSLSQLLESPMPEHFDPSSVHNPAEPSSSLASLRRTNRYRSDPTTIRPPQLEPAEPLQRLSRLISKLRPCEDPRPEDEASALFSGHFSDSNRLLSAMLSMDLASQGYSTGT